jgi:hypothetical protein
MTRWTAASSKRLACVVVEIMEQGQYHLACKGGVLENVNLHQYLRYEENKTPAFYELEEAIEKWRSMDKVSTRAGSNKVSMAGGQGHLHCNCSGICNNNRYCATADAT